MNLDQNTSHHSLSNKAIESIFTKAPKCLPSTRDAKVIHIVELKCDKQEGIFKQRMPLLEIIFVFTSMRNIEIILVQPRI